MAVVIETTLGDIIVDLYLEQRPATCLNFLKLCKMKYYNFNLFHTIRSGFIAQTGDPTGDGSGGESIWGLLEGSSKRFFSAEKMPKIRHTDAGLLSMVCTDNMMVGSQFFFTLAPDLDSLDGVHCVIGEVTEGHEVLTKLNEVICDETHRPYQDVRITHTVVLEDPFNDLPGLRPPSRSPSPNAERLRGGRIAPDEEIDETQGKSHEEIQEMIEEKEAKARATILEIVGDLPDADIAPPENVLFVCKLNPVTTDDDLEIIFSRFGKIVSCEVIRDKKTGDSLQYAFIEFEDKKSCEDAYFKMDNVLIDDRRIHVDFSQSVSKMRWLGKGRGVQYFNEKESKPVDPINNRSKRSHSPDRFNDRRHHYKDKDNKQRDNTDRNDKQSNSYRKERDRSKSRSGRDISKSMHFKRDRTQSDKDYYKEENDNKHHRDNYSNKSNVEKKYSNNYAKPGKSVRKQSPAKTDKRNQSRSPVSKQRKSDNNKKYKRERSNDRHTSNNHTVSKNDKPLQKEIRHAKNSLRLKDSNKHSKSDSREECEVGPHTPSPITEERNIKSKKKDSVKKLKKTINNVTKNKKRQKRSSSTSSSGSDTSDSSSTSTESSSSSDGHKKKRALKGRKRHHSTSSSSSTSSSTSSSDSTSTSSSSSSGASGSSSESEDAKKKPKKKSKINSGKKAKKL